MALDIHAKQNFITRESRNCDALDPMVQFMKKGKYETGAHNVRCVSFIYVKIMIHFVQFSTRIWRMLYRPCCLTHPCHWFFSLFPLNPQPHPARINAYIHEKKHSESRLEASYVMYMSWTFVLNLFFWVFFSPFALFKMSSPRDEYIRFHLTLSGTALCESVTLCKMLNFPSTFCVCKMFACMQATSQKFCHHYHKVKIDSIWKKSVLFF